MGLLKRFFNKDPAEADDNPRSLLFRESEPDDEDDEGNERPSRNGPRRELVQVVLRDTMRKHGIPSDWIDCRMLSTVGHSGRPELYVSLIVKQAHERLLGYLFTFQDSFLQELVRFEPKAREWFLGLAWEFQDPPTDKVSVPAAGAWQAPAAAGAAAPAAAAAPAPAPAEEDDVEQDLKALFAIRDAVLAQPPGQTPPEFEPTRPGFEDTESEAR